MSLRFARAVNEQRKDLAERGADAVAASSGYAAVHHEARIGGNETEFAAKKLAEILWQLADHDPDYAPELKRIVSRHDTVADPHISGNPWKTSVSHPVSTQRVDEGWILSQRNHYAGATFPRNVLPFDAPNPIAHGLMLTTDGRVVTYSSYLTHRVIRDEHGRVLPEGSRGKKLKVTKEVNRTPTGQYVVGETVIPAHNQITGYVYGANGTSDKTLDIGATDDMQRLYVNDIVRARVGDPTRADDDGFYLDALLAVLANRYAIPPAAFV